MKTKKKCEPSGTFTRNSRYIIGSPRRKGRNLFKEIMHENFPNLRGDLHLLVLKLIYFTPEFQPEVIFFKTQCNKTI